MKTTTSVKNITLSAFVAGMLAMPLLVEAGQGMGGGMGGAAGGGPGMQNAGSGNGMGGGMGPGGRGGRGMRFNQGNMAGWSLMTPEERSAQQARMRNAGSVAECQRIQAEHRSVMQARATEKGVTLPTPRQNACQRLAARGFLK